MSFELVNVLYVLYVLDFCVNRNRKETRTFTIIEMSNIFILAAK